MYMYAAHVYEYTSLHMYELFVNTSLCTHKSTYIYIYMQVCICTCIRDQYVCILCAKACVHEIPGTEFAEWVSQILWSGSQTSQVILFNEPAIQLYKMNSFLLIDKLIDFYLVKGRRYDAYLYAMFMHGAKPPLEVRLSQPRLFSLLALALSLYHYRYTHILHKIAYIHGELYDCIFLSVRGRWKWRAGGGKALLAGGEGEISFGTMLLLALRAVWDFHCDLLWFLHCLILDSLSGLLMILL